MCPRYTTDDTPCNFEITYLTLPIGGNSMHKRERYSYVVLKKGTLARYHIVMSVIRNENNLGTINKFPSTYFFFKNV